MLDGLVVLDDNAQRACRLDNGGAVVRGGQEEVEHLLPLALPVLQNPEGQSLFPLAGGKLHPRDGGDGEVFGGVDVRLAEEGLGERGELALRGLADRHPALKLLQLGEGEAFRILRGFGGVFRLRLIGGNVPVRRSVHAVRHETLDRVERFPGLPAALFVRGVFKDRSVALELFRAPVAVLHGVVPAVDRGDVHGGDEDGGGKARVACAAQRQRIESALRQIRLTGGKSRIGDPLRVFHHRQFRRGKQYRISAHLVRDHVHGENAHQHDGRQNDTENPFHRSLQNSVL